MTRGTRVPARSRRPALLVAGAAVILATAALASVGSGVFQSPGTPAWTYPPVWSGSAASPTPDVARYLVVPPRAAQPIALEDASTASVTLASMRGTNVLVFFGYTHCPDVCPATIGNIGETMRAFGPGVRALFVSVDPERDTPEWLQQYDQYLPAGLTVLTGTAAEIRATANAWGVKYARVETATPGAYSMSHTADVFLVDGAGLLRADFPFGTDSEAMTAVLRAVGQPSAMTASGSAGPADTSAPSASTPPASAPRGGASPASAPPASAPPPAATSGPPASTAAGVAQDVRMSVVSTSIWAGNSTPVIFTLDGSSGPLEPAPASVSVQLMTTGGAATGAPVDATVVHPPGEGATYYVATLGIPSPGWWRLAATAAGPNEPILLDADVAVLDPGTTAALGGPAPSVHTPTLDDVGGDPLAVTTDPAPDLRLSRTSTTDALAQHAPFVLVIDSTRFRVTSACGKAIVMARYLLDRWPAVDFIHLEPFRYSVVTDTAVIDGSLADPQLTDPAAAWGIGGSPWGAVSMPWVFVVDGRGVVRAKYQGVMGSDDVDVMLSLIAAGG